jgi:hypothetical protein
MGLTNAGVRLCLKSHGVDTVFRNSRHQILITIGKRLGKGQALLH